MQLPRLAWVVVALALPFASWCTVLIRDWARRRDVLDLPNERKAHTTPTPRGGGLAIVVTVLAGVAIGGALGWVRLSLMAALIIGGAAVAIVSWLDDVYGLSVAARLVVHILAAAGALACIGGVGHVSVGPSIHRLGVTGNLIIILGMVWVTNLYNFMDGADGFAALEAASVAALAALIMPGTGHEARYLTLLLAAAALGFLRWNVPPASVFMGDVGSCFIGFYFGVLIIDAKASSDMPLTVWVIMLGVFVTDGTLTLLRRMAAGKRWSEAHRTHAYQRLLKAGWTPRQLYGPLLLINLGLMGVAWTIMQSPPSTIAQLLIVGPAMIGLYLLIERLAPLSKWDDPNDQRRES